EKSTPQGTLPQSPTQASAGSSAQPVSTGAAGQHERLTEDQRIAIIRAISGEFVRAQIPLPGGKEGMHIAASKPYTPPKDPSQAPADPHSPLVFTVPRSPAVHEGDKVQITRIEFKEKSIVLDINGGGAQKFHWRDHFGIGVGGAIASATGPGTPNA